MSECQALTPEEISHMNGKVRQLPIIKEIEAKTEALSENDKIFMQKLENLEHGQDDIEHRLDDGSEQFKALWDKVANVERSVNDVKNIFTDGIDSLKKEIFNSKLDAAISNNTRLAQENQDLRTKLDTKDAKSWDVTKMVLVALLSLTVAGLIYALGWK